MSTADFLSEHMLWANDIDPFIDPDQRPGAQSPNLYEPEAALALPYPLLGLPGGEKSCLNQVGGTREVLHSFNTGPCPIDSQTSPCIASQEDVPQELKKTNTKLERNPSTRTPKQKPSTKKPAKTAPRARKQPRRDATKASEPSAEVQDPESMLLTKKRIQNRRRRSLERNRVAASKCRRRKRQWTDNIEQQKSDLESMHHKLQAQYMSLLQESCQLKNSLINHASCHDKNIDIWIKNEAAKFVQNLQKSSRSNSLFSTRSLDGKQFDLFERQSAIARDLASLERQDLDMDDYFDEEEGDPEE